MSDRKRRDGKAGDGEDKSEKFGKGLKVSLPFLFLGGSNLGGSKDETKNRKYKYENRGFGRSS